MLVGRTLVNLQQPVRVMNITSQPRRLPKSITLACYEELCSVQSPVSRKASPAQEIPPHLAPLYTESVPNRKLSRFKICCRSTQMCSPKGQRIWAIQILCTITFVQVMLLPSDNPPDDFLLLYVKKPREPWLTKRH